MDESTDAAPAAVPEQVADPVTPPSAVVDYSEEWRQELTETIFLPKYAKHPNFKAYLKASLPSPRGISPFRELLLNISRAERKELLGQYLAMQSPILAAKWFNGIYPGRLNKPLLPKPLVALYDFMRKLQGFKEEFERYDKYIGVEDEVLQPILEKIRKYLEKIDEAKDLDRISRAQLINTLIMKYVARLKESEAAAVDNDRAEKMVQEYLGEIQKLVLQLHDLSTEKINVVEVESIVRGELSYVLDAVKIVVLEMIPEQYDFFVKKLRSRLTEKGLLPTTEKSEDQKP